MASIPSMIPRVNIFFIFFHFLLIYFNFPEAAAFGHASVWHPGATCVAGSHSNSYGKGLKIITNHFAYLDFHLRAM